MDRNHSVLVTFERRPKLHVQHSSPDPMAVRWYLTMTAQKSGGNPRHFNGTFDCNFPSGLPYCQIDGYYDLGTTVTLQVGTGGVPGNWKG